MRRRLGFVWACLVLACFAAYAFVVAVLFLDPWIAVLFLGTAAFFLLAPLLDSWAHEADAAQVMAAADAEPTMCFDREAA